MNKLNNGRAKHNVDANELEKFSRIASEWWNPKGKFRPLHQIGRSRLTYILDQIGNQFSLKRSGSESLNGLSIVDIGCGGGLICEPLAQLGANVTGIDPALENIEAARHHCADQGLEIQYLAIPVQELLKFRTTFDVAICLEVLEHVPDVERFLKECKSLLNENGIAIFSTINRTLKSYALAIVGAEYILRWLPAGTHNWNKFIKPEEMSDALNKSELTIKNLTGLVYNPVLDSWTFSDDIDVNYFITAAQS